jgi:predicted outer membrane lipoprotein
MSRNLFILACVLLLFSMLAFGMMFAPNSAQPGLPANGTLWKTASMFLLLGALVVAFFGVLTAMYEQVDRRAQERRRLEESLELRMAMRSGIKRSASHDDRTR